MNKSLFPGGFHAQTTHGRLVDRWAHCSQRSDSSTGTYSAPCTPSSGSKAISCSEVKHESLRARDAAWAEVFCPDGSWAIAPVCRPLTRASTLVQMSARALRQMLRTSDHRKLVLNQTKRPRTGEAGQKARPRVSPCMPKQLFIHAAEAIRKFSIEARSRMNDESNTFSQ